VSKKTAEVRRGCRGGYDESSPDCVAQEVNTGFVVGLEPVRVELEGVAVGNEGDSLGNVSRVRQPWDVEEDGVDAEPGEGDVQGIGHPRHIFDFRRTVYSGFKTGDVVKVDETVSVLEELRGSSHGSD
jgi:hypothetical protein